MTRRVGLVGQALERGCRRQQRVADRGEAGRAALRRPAPRRRRRRRSWRRLMRVQSTVTTCLSRSDHSSTITSMRAVRAAADRVDHRRVLEGARDALVLELVFVGIDAFRDIDREDERDIDRLGERACREALQASAGAMAKRAGVARLTSGAPPRRGEPACRGGARRGARPARRSRASASAPDGSALIGRRDPGEHVGDDARALEVAQQQVIAAPDRGRRAGARRRRAAGRRRSARPRGAARSRPARHRG